MRRVAVSTLEVLARGGGLILDVEVVEARTIFEVGTGSVCLVWTGRMGKGQSN